MVLSHQESLSAYLKYYFYTIVLIFQPSSVTTIDAQGISSAVEIHDSPSPSSSDNVWEIPRPNLTVGDLKESGRFSEMCFGKVVLKNSQQVPVLVKRAKGKTQ